MEYVRIIDIPEQLAISSGVCTEEDPFAPDSLLWRFDRFISSLSAKLGRCDFPRDFMWFDHEKEGLEWIYTVDDMPEDCEGFEHMVFDGGLFAAACSRDGDESDGERVNAFLHDWVQGNDSFELDCDPGRHSMFRVVSSQRAADILGYHQLEVLVPVKARERAPLEQNSSENEENTAE